MFRVQVDISRALGGLVCTAVVFSWHGVVLGSGLRLFINICQS